MLVLFCVLQVFSGVLWSFLYEYICKYLLFISLYRSEMVLIMRVCVYVYVVYFLFASVTMSSSVCYLFVFTEVRCSFLCKDVIKCMLYISLYRGEIVLICEYVCKCMLFIFLCKCEMVIFMKVCYQMSAFYFSLQRRNCSFYVDMFLIVCCLFLFTEMKCPFLCDYFCRCMLYISLYRDEMVLFMWVCLRVYVVYFSL